MTKMRILIWMRATIIIISMTITSTGGVLPAPDGPPVRHVSHYGDTPSPAVCQVILLG